MILLNGTPINPTIFPDGTSQVWQIKEGISSNNVIEWRFEDEGELFHLAQLKELIDTTAILKPTSTLYMPYLPYARQDKCVSNENSFALKIFSKTINRMKFDQVSFVDAHSEMATRWIDNSVDIFPEIPIPDGVDVICFPDAGAKTRYEGRFERGEIEIVYGDKVRDQDTGYISHYELNGDICALDRPNRNILVVDDLCDGGKTFEILGKNLHQITSNHSTACKAYLYVTHGIFSKGLDELTKHYDGVYVKHIVGSYTQEMLDWIENGFLIVQDGALIR